jgi:hypothetical protein
MKGLTQEPTLATAAGAVAGPAPTRVLPCAFLVSAGVVAVLVLTAVTSPGHLGAPTYWPWALTGLQVTALWGAGAAEWWGWPLGAAVQPPWIAYALVTDQLGFIPGCIVSGLVQTVSSLRRRPDRRPEPRERRSNDTAAIAS